MMKGDFVGICASTILEFFLLDYAIILLGAVLVPIPTNFGENIEQLNGSPCSDDEGLQHVISSTRLTCIFCEREFTERFLKYKIELVRVATRSWFWISSESSVSEDRWDRSKEPAETPSTTRYERWDRGRRSEDDHTFTSGGLCEISKESGDDKNIGQKEEQRRVAPAQARSPQTDRDARSRGGKRNDISIHGRQNSGDDPEDYTEKAERKRKERKEKKVEKPSLVDRNQEDLTQADQIFTIIFTSGSTGVPKVAIHW